MRMDHNHDVCLFVTLFPMASLNQELDFLFLLSSYQACGLFNIPV